MKGFNFILINLKDILFRQLFRGGKVGASNHASESLAAKNVFKNNKAEFKIFPNKEFDIVDYCINYFDELGKK